MLGLGSSLYKAGKVGKSIIRDGLVLKHDYNAGAVQPCSTGAASFTASNTDYIDMGDVCDLGTGDFSISCWVNLGSTTTSQYIVSKYVDANNFWYLRTQGSSQIQFYSKVSGSDVIDRGTGTSLAGNTWHHVAITADRGTATKSYINGVEMASGASSATDLDNAASLYFGRAGSDYIGGYIANVGIWSAALTQAKVKSIMLKDYAALSASEKTGLVSWWNLDSTITSTSVLDNHYAGGSELGSEILNQPVLTGTGWTNVNGTVSGGVGTVTIPADGTYSYFRGNPRSSDYTEGAVYKVVVTVKGTAGKDIRVRSEVGSDNGGLTATTGRITLTGDLQTETLYFTSNDQDDDFRIERHSSDEAYSFEIHAASLKKVNGNTGTLS